MDKILLDNNEFHFNEKDLPCLVHYSPGVGGSHFSVTMAADLFLGGSKILFLTAYPMAKENFLNQVTGYENDVLFVTKKDQIVIDKRVLIIESGNEDLFLTALSDLKDINERIIFVKNFEVFSEDTVLLAAQSKRAIISGNLDVFLAKAKLLERGYKTIIQFSQSTSIINPPCPDLEKYVGFFWQTDASGLLKVVSN